MDIKKLELTDGEAAVLGGAVLGGGGGGSIEGGMHNAGLAVNLGTPTLIALDQLDGDDLVITASAVGAPAAKEKMVRPVDHIRALELFRERNSSKLAGIICNENGAGSGVNGWIESAATGLPVVDAPNNGRAHPTGLMGAMGLHRVKDYVSSQTGVGGNPELGRYLEVAVKGSLQYTANMIRHAAVEAGGLVAVMRDPVSAAYLRENAAIGAVEHAMGIGRAMMAARTQGAKAVIQAVLGELQGEIACQGRIDQINLTTVGGYDVGELTVIGDEKMELTFWNEFMTLECQAERRASFPDLITLLSLETGIPVSSAQAEVGQEVAVLLAPRENLILGRGVLLPETIAEAETAVGKKLWIE